MHLESTLSLKERRADAAPPAPAAGPRLSLKGSKGAKQGARAKGRAPLLGEVGKRQTLNVFAADGRDVSAEVGSEEAVVDETAFVKQPSVIFTRGKKGMHYTLLLLDYHKEEGSAPHHRLHWLITDIPGLEFASGDLGDGIVLADFEPPRVPQAHQPRLYVLMVFEQRPATPPNTPTDVLLQPGLQGGLQGHQGPLGRHPDLQQFLGDRSSFPLTSWLRSNSPKMARIAACQQFRAHLSDTDLSGLSIAGLPDQQRDDQGVLGDVEDSEHSSDERPPQQHQDHDKENQAADPSRKSKRSKLSRLRRLLRRKQHCPV
ncbi:uncharacterized protein LOC113205109 [Frankliniella occidentalis]|uniref:Uncharacterized protein LOC113205109 n=1 Tax=Frankliniella occidentalis TaxID=133901 RepID=A0A6J1SCK3_FRAOC|nr:uncharacterized protein LOC113205109 [Frankliniella occidentalis]